MNIACKEEGAACNLLCSAAVHGGAVAFTNKETHRNDSNGRQPNGLQPAAPCLCPTPCRPAVGRNWQFCLPLLKPPHGIRAGLVDGLAVGAR